MTWRLGTGGQEESNREESNSLIGIWYQGFSLPTQGTKWPSAQPPELYNYPENHYQKKPD